MRYDEKASGFCHAEKNANDISVLPLFSLSLAPRPPSPRVFVFSDIRLLQRAYLNKSSKPWYGKPKPITMVQFTQFLMTIKTSNIINTQQKRERENKMKETNNDTWKCIWEYFFPCTLFQLFESNYCRLASPKCQQAGMGTKRGSPNVWRWCSFLVSVGVGSWFSPPFAYLLEIHFRARQFSFMWITRVKNVPFLCRTCVFAYFRNAALCYTFVERLNFPRFPTSPNQRKKNSSPNMSWRVKNLFDLIGSVQTRFLAWNAKRLGLHM